MKKNILSSRIKEYSALATCILGAADMAHGQVIHTDVNPDIIIHGNEDFALDLNNDGITDFYFIIEEESYWSNGYVNIATANVNSNSVVITATYYSDFFPAVFEYGDSIKPSLNWQHANDEVLGHAFKFWQGAYYSSFLSGSWLNKYEKFLPLRFIINNENHYGWVKLSVTGWANKITIHNYAYESQPDTPISAGCPVYYLDADNDYHGASDDPGTVLCQNPGAGFSISNDDCDDSNAEINPAVPEILNNNLDDDCNGYIDEFPTGNLTAITDEYSLIVFPNPSSGKFMIDLLLNDKQSSEARIEVINATTQTIYSEKVNIQQGKLKKEISLQDVAINGVYILKISIGTNVLKVLINMKK